MGDACASALQHRVHLALCRHERFLAALRETAVSVFRQLDREICAELERDEDPCGSTALVAVFDGKRRALTVANVGDSRCVLSRGGSALELTRDHRLTRKDERERIEAAGGVIVHHRVNGQLAVSRSFGDVEHKGSDGPTTVVATPEVFVEPVSEADEFMVIATDGLWDVMASQEVVNFVRSRLSEHRDLARVAKELTQEALHNASVDNVSAVIVAFNQAPR